jgi:hypothetical protein
MMDALKEIEETVQRTGHAVLLFEVPRWEKYHLAHARSFWTDRVLPLARNAKKVEFVAPASSDARAERMTSHSLLGPPFDETFIDRWTAATEKDGVWDFRLVLCTSLDAILRSGLVERTASVGYYSKSQTPFPAKVRAAFLDGGITAALVLSAPPFRSASIVVRP